MIELVKSTFIQSIGTAVPTHKISQELHYSIIESANGMSREQKLLLRRIYSNSGIEHRHSVLAEFGHGDREDNTLFHPAGVEPALSTSHRMGLYEKYAADLCVEAVNDCFAKLSSFKPSDVTHLITFSCTGMYAPGLDVQLVEKLGLNRNVERTCINFMGCYAGINALKVAYHITRSQPGAVVLLAGVELCSLHYHKSEEQNQMVANALFSDGASAAIVSASEHSGNKLPILSMLNFYSEFDPSGDREMVWRIGDYGFDLQLSPAVPALIKSSIRALTDKLFEQAKIKQTDIDYYALHPGGTKILEACEHALGITKDQNQFSYRVLRDNGNMSSVTIFFVLKKYLETLSDEDAGKKILACAFGPGLTMESMVLEVG